MALNSDLSCNGLLSEKAVDPNNVKYYKGILTPGFVNAHCHLELSHLKNKIPQHTGLPAFGMGVIKQRGSSTERGIEDAQLRADREMHDNGIVAVGDISNATASINTKKQSRLHYHTFVELIGLNPQRSNEIFAAGLQTLHKFKEAGLSASLAPHAPYSTSRELIKLIAEHDEAAQMPLSIHNQESEEERKFFTGQKSGFNDLYDFLKQDISWFKAPGTSSLKHYGDLLPPGRSMLVHDTFTTKEDMAFVSSKNVSWCFCPGANLYIGNALPAFSLFKHCAHSLCIGTDSLASNSQLNVVAEANLLLKAAPVFSQEEILAMLTLNGAKALGIADNFGHFAPGKNCGINLVDFRGTELCFIQKIA